jgi:hypothetical protein
MPVAAVGKTGKIAVVLFRHRQKRDETNEDGEDATPEPSGEPDKSGEPGA